MTAAQSRQPRRHARTEAGAPKCLARTLLSSDAPTSSAIGWRRFGRPSEYVPHLHFVGAFHLDGPAGFAIELVLDQVVGAAGDLDGSARAVGFHAACQVHSSAPEIVDELLSADDTGHHRAGVDADAERELVIAECPSRHGLAHVDRKLHESGRVVGRSRGTPAATM